MEHDLKAFSLGLGESLIGRVIPGIKLKIWKDLKYHNV